MADLYRYLEYREFLPTEYEEHHAHSPTYSYRYLAGKLGERQQYFSRWYVVAMRSLLDNQPFDGDFAKLARSFSPAITLHQAKEAFYMLESLGMIVKQGDSWVPTDGHLHSGPHWSGEAVRQFQSSCIQLANRSLHKNPPHARDISTMTMSINSGHLERIRVLIQEFQDAVVKVLEPPEPCDRVVQLNIQLFPVTKP